MRVTRRHISGGLWDLVFEWEVAADALITRKIDEDEYSISMRQYWDDVSNYLIQNPNEAKTMFQDHYPLQRYLNRDYEDHIEHLVCPPSLLIKQLIECNPNAVFVIDDRGNTLLHNFCLYSSSSKRSFEIIQILCEAYPQALHTQNINGDIPLHNYMWSNDHHNDFYILPTLSLYTPYHLLHHQNQSGETPLDNLCIRMGLIYQSPSRTNKQYLLPQIMDGHCPTTELHINETWMNVIVLVSSATISIMNRIQYQRNDGACRNQCINACIELHSFIFFNCPLYFLQMSINFLSHQLPMRDPCFDMSTPLGIIVSSKTLEGSIEKRSDLGKKRSVIKCILDKNPQVARLRCTKDLLLPLHLSLYAGNVLYQSDAIDLLIEAAPSTLESRDPNHHFYPFQLAACCKPQHRSTTIEKEKGIELQHLESIFSLLREVPWLIEP